MLKALLRSMFRGLNKLQAWVEEGNPTEKTQPPHHPHKLTELSENESIGQSMRAPRFKVVNVWSYLAFKEGTQAHHIVSVLDFVEWESMEEILRRVNELFGIVYQNERSLYPYLKTLVDSGLLEASMVGGKMRWKKKNLMITIGEEEEERAHNKGVESQTLQ